MEFIICNPVELRQTISFIDNSIEADILLGGNGVEFITRRSEGQQRSREEENRKSIKDREGTQGETAREDEEADWETAGKEKREDAKERGTGSKTSEFFFFPVTTIMCVLYNNCISPPSYAGDYAYPRSDKGSDAFS